ncbi:Rieske (2Fe-2S) protein [Novosphingobium sp. 9U]|uniref:Rieske (2Fe-2S) protein n=1 Tax=Novosphingobium sp. 9U TaxID=2653158 RepID=UPI0012F0C88C|nr:Rieske (2Fe-2S) protein [Novosphingobium sp. 9U]VWX50156.1 (2Fe-2S)-binding protein [Novosphingobium sp. 9U]
MPAALAEHVEHDVAASAQVAAGTPLGVKAGAWHVVLARTEDGVVHALNDRCPHAASRLSTGRMRKGQLMCPLHGARFGVTSGHCVGAAYAPVRTFPVREDRGRVLVSVPTRPPELAEVPLF